MTIQGKTYSREAEEWINKIKMSSGGVNGSIPIAPGPRNSQASSGTGSGSGGGRGTTPPSPGGSGGGSFKRFAKNNPFVITLVAFLFVALVSLVVNQLLLELQLRNMEKIEEIERKREERIAKQQKPPSAAFLKQPAAKATGIQKTIEQCGRYTDEEKYKLQPGCFFFDNFEGRSPKTVEVRTAGKFFSIESIYPRKSDGKAFITLSASGGTTCESSATDNCTDWIRKHSVKDAEGFITFMVRVPQGQGLLANIDS